MSAAESRLSRTALRDTFRCSIALKGLHALIESITGAALLFVPARMLNHIVLLVGRVDLSLNRSDVINEHLRRAAAHLVGTGRHFAAAYLLSHGLVKLILVVELLRNRLWAYPLMIVMLSAFVGYQSYRYWLTHSIAMVVLTLFDLAVIVLTWLEFRAQRRLGRQGT